MSLLEGGDVEHELTAARRENLGSVLIDSTTMAEAHVPSFEQTSGAGSPPNPTPSAGLSPSPASEIPLRRHRDDPEPICPECGGLLRRVEVEGRRVKVWRCDLHGIGLLPVWAAPIRDEQEGHFPYPTEER